VPVDSQAKLAQQNLLGSRYVNIKKGMSKQTIQAGAEISSADTPEIEDLFQQALRLWLPCRKSWTGST